MNVKALKHKFQRRIALVIMLFLGGCEWTYDDRSELERIRDRGVLRVGTLNNQLSYYIGPDGPTGLDYELAYLFAQRLGVQLEMQPTHTLSGLFQVLRREDVDIIAAGLTITQDRLNKFRPGPAYYFVDQHLVYRNGHWRPRNMQEVNKNGARLAVATSSSHALSLAAMQKEYPSLVWESVDNIHDDDLLKQVADGKLDFTISDSANIALIQRTHPEITEAFPLSENEPVAWFMNKTQDDSLYALLIEFFGQMTQSGQLATLEEKYFGHVDSFDFVDTRAFLRAISSTLPTWEGLFKKYANDFDWRLLAALSYQESHWDPDALSPTGVRGMMMLTLPTAKSVGVTNRLDPEQSIQGGAIYLRRMLNRMPDSIDEHEKIWFALASYNIGIGHMMDARRITESLGADPNSWAQVKERLPLLTKTEYNKNTRYGYARGYEALRYVENIRRYYQSLVGYEEEQQRVAPIDSNVANNLEQLKTINVKTKTPKDPSKDVSNAARVKKSFASDGISARLVPKEN